ncbi:phosphatase PAP2 family protein [Microbacterium sp. M3]|jgi:membrane-associated phospholipid phosphatase|uniref:Phosphatase PAP2 family protein n=1 Tax=Microbacterium arthrosphaerae TaxID=792652 RepID=A0ABU4GYV8_9MICO|nr:MULTISPECIES: phosphatase PAP2 family protein [Microbacterium]MDW4571649.1 phosphatase PAP2 family protein [Microbacterium arthrosphaerae]MDW7605504.1 phosphatase PAP2 family protein [Microbacterium sp. M3]
MTDTQRRVRTSVLTLLLVGGALVVLSCLLGWWIFVRGEEPFVIDVWWNQALLDTTHPVLLAFSRFMNWIGGGWVGVLAVPIAGAVALILLRRPWAAAYFLAAEAVSAAGVQVLKHLFGRVRPEDILVVSDYGSYPSGHVANAATLAVAAFIIFPRAWVAVVGAVWVFLMAFSRTYLHAHWLSDTVGGAMIGAGAALLVAAAFAVPMARERQRRLPAARR